jgi:hypothetical protein
MVSDHFRRKISKGVVLTMLPQMRNYELVVGTHVDVLGFQISMIHRIRAVVVVVVEGKKKKQAKEESLMIRRRGMFRVSGVLCCLKLKNKKKTKNKKEES